MFKSIFNWGSLILLLFACGNLHATSYYVSTSGTGNASSWTNKQIYKSFSWTKLAGGDTVYFDGGIYSLSSVFLFSNINPTSTVVITKGKDAGHNGEVIIQNITTSNLHTINISGCRNLKFTGLTIKAMCSGVDAPTTYIAALRVDNSTNITIDSCNITSNGHGSGIYLNSVTTPFITNNRIEVLDNSVNMEADVIHVNHGDNATITGNTLKSGKLNANAHPDLLQFGNYGGTPTNRKVTTIANNFMLCLNTSCPMMAGINSDNTQPTQWLIYNNIIVQKNSGNTGIVLYDGYDESTYNGKSSAKIFNNTVINGSGQNAKLGNLDTLVMKNNIFYNTGSSNENVWFSDRDGFTPLVKDIDYNQYYSGSNSNADIDTGSATGIENSDLILTKWQVKGYDTHGSTAVPSFVNFWGTNATDYQLAPGSEGIDKGTTIPLTSPAFDGTVRPQGAAYDRGAFEYTSGINNNNPVPNLGSIFPTNAVAGSTDLVLTVTGTNFTSSSLVQFNGTSLATTYVSVTSLTATIPKALLISPGTANITVVSPAPGGGTSTAKTFTINAANNPTPTLGSISPITAVAGTSALLLTVTGTNFISSSVVQFNGTSLATTYVSVTSLTATIPKALLISPGTANITVVSPAPGGGTTSAKTFTITVVNNPNPTMGSISPSTIVAGSSDVALTVTGTNFISSSVVQFNGISLTTTYISTTSLSTTITLALIAAVGTANITVVNPTPGGGTTAIKTFTITASHGGSGTIPKATINLTALLESYYVAGGIQMTLAPWVTIELHNATAPYGMVDSNSSVLSTAGFGTFIFTKAVSGISYYLLIKSFNTIDTWSATPINFTTSSVSYNFTTAVTQAYTDGSNPPLSLHNSKYCIYSGDLNHDGYVNSLDYAGVDNDNAALTYHPINDLNGDGYVTSADDQAIDNNKLLAIHRQVPGSASGLSITNTRSNH
jgi:hypothetical protein